MSQASWGFPPGRGFFLFGALGGCPSFDSPNPVFCSGRRACRLLGAEDSLIQFRKDRVARGHRLAQDYWSPAVPLA